MTGRTAQVVHVRDVADDPDEHAAVGALVLAAYDGVGRINGPYRTELADTGGRVRRGARVLVAVDGADVLGTVTVVAADGDDFEHGCHGDGGMRMLGVLPAAQGRGVGSALVDATLDHARELGWRRLVLTSMAWMPAAHRLYMGRGFVRRPDLDMRFRSGIGLVFSRDMVPGAAAAFPPPGPVPVTPPDFSPRRRDVTSC